MSKKRPKRSVRRAPKRAKPVSKALVKRRPVAKSAATSTALVKRNELRVIGDGINLDALGLVELHATLKEEAILAREPSATTVMIKPTGQPYLPHVVYTRWLNEAFGRGGWSLVPVGKPSLIEKTVTCPYILYVHGRPVAFAQGEQEYHANNRDQSYGDALESTVASGLRRTCKRIGIGLELWDRKWLTKWRAEHAIRVRVEVTKYADGKPDKRIMQQWRRKDDELLKGELAGTRSARREPPVQHADLDKAITAEMRERFWRIARRAGREEAEIKPWLEQTYGVTKTDEIKVRDFEPITNALEAPGPLGAPPSREPGDDDE